MKKLYLITLPERIWHWLNALLFIALAATGLLMHASENLESISLGALIRVHNLAALVFIINFLFWLVYQVLSGRIRHYLNLEKDIVARFIAQARFYLVGIFKGEPHPYPATEDSKFNPIQRLTYLGLMLALVPLQILTGAALYGFTIKVEWLADLPAFRTIALAHTGLSYLLVSFLIGHLYLATTGDTLFALLKSMITGYHRETDEGKEA